MKKPVKKNLKNPFKNDLNGYTNFQPDSNRMLLTFQSI